MNCVWYFQTFHAISMPPFLEVHLECSSTPITIVTTDLTFILDSKAMQFVEPIRNRLTIPTQR